ncbi:MAG: NFYB/HAP3 family transcription factor subunit [Nanoarchaeota archaeon]|nr:NFYB/HAP3 family transcription factor subunit [Nanoarchaeota archaeon]
MISISSAKQVFKKKGAKRVSKGAAIELKKILEQKGEEIARNAIKNASHSGRVVIKTEDVNEE